MLDCDVARIRDHKDTADSFWSGQVKRFLAWWRNWSAPYYAGRAVGRMLAQQSPTFVELSRRIWEAEKRVEQAEGLAREWECREARACKRAAALQAILETRNLHGGWMPNA
jgi:hypothetical protein